MKANQLAVVILTIFSPVLALVAVGTDEWIIGDNNKKIIGLFTSCNNLPLCSNNFTTFSIGTSVLFVSAIVEMLFGSIMIFIGWNKAKQAFENLGLLLIFISSLQLCTGSGIFTYISCVLKMGPQNWGLSFILAWGSSGASALASLLAIHYFFKNHRVVVHFLSKKETRTPKAAFIKEARV